MSCITRRKIVWRVMSPPHLLLPHSRLENLVKPPPAPDAAYTGRHDVQSLALLPATASAAAATFKIKPACSTCGPFRFRVQKAPKSTQHSDSAAVVIVKVVFVVVVVVVVVAVAIGVGGGGSGGGGVADGGGGGVVVIVVGVFGRHGGDFTRRSTWGGGGSGGW